MTYLDLGDGFWGIALGDVCGKGMAAALLMSATRSLFRTAAEGLESPSGLLMRLNQALLKDLPEGRFVTLFYSILDTKRATVRVANGGHPYPIFVREQTNNFSSTAVRLHPKASATRPTISSGNFSKSSRS